MKRSTIGNAVLNSEPEIIIEEIMNVLQDTGGMADVWTFDVTQETLDAIKRTLRCESTPCQLQSYLSTKITQTINSVNESRFPVDRIVL